MTASVASSNMIGASCKADIFTMTQELINKRNAALQLATNTNYKLFKVIGSFHCLSIHISQPPFPLRRTRSTQDIPRLRTLTSNRFRCGNSIASLIPKLEKANAIYQHRSGNYHNRVVARNSRVPGGKFSPEYVAAAQVSYLTWKMGGGNLLRTTQIVNAGLSKTVLQRRMKEGILWTLQI